MHTVAASPPSTRPTPLPQRRCRPGRGGRKIAPTTPCNSPPLGHDALPAPIGRATASRAATRTRRRGARGSPGRGWANGRCWRGSGTSGGRGRDETSCSEGRGVGDGAVRGQMAGTGPAMTETGWGASGDAGAQRPHATACHRATSRWWDGGPLGGARRCGGAGWRRGPGADGRDRPGHDGDGVGGERRRWCAKTPCNSLPPGYVPVVGRWAARGRSAVRWGWVAARAGGRWPGQVRP